MGSTRRQDEGSLYRGDLGRRCMGRMYYETEEGEHGYQRLKGGALAIVDPSELPEDVRRAKLAELDAFKCDIDSPAISPNSTVPSDEMDSAYDGFVWSNTIPDED